MQLLEGKNAIVTGAGQNVGAGIASTLAAASATVWVNDIVAARAQATVDSIIAEGGKAEAIIFDVTDAAAVTAAIGQPQQFDILVNNVGNAGITAMEQQSLLDMSEATIKQIIDTNLYGLINCSRAVLPAMINKGHGRIINIGSEAGRQGLNIGVSVYGAAKAAAANLLRHLSQEVARSGITCNSVALGLMNNVPEEFTQYVIPSIPLGRLGTPEDAAQMCLFLASEASSWITGQEFVVNGGSSVRG